MSLGSYHFVSSLSTSLSQIREVDLTGFSSLPKKKTCFAHPFEHWTMHVTNEMQNGQNFLLTSKSKNDDMRVWFLEI